MVLIYFPDHKYHLYLIFFCEQFYSLPFCEGTGKQKRHKQDLGETLSGSHKVTTPYELTFLDPVPWRSLCEEYLDAQDVSQSDSLSSYSTIIVIIFQNFIMIDYHLMQKEIMFWMEQ